MARSRPLLQWILVLIGLPLIAIAGMWVFMTVKKPVLHPNPQAIPSVAHTNPSPQWSEAVDRARRIIRAGLAERNLPGLSVAVGIGRDIVWSEGFGWADI